MAPSRPSKPYHLSKIEQILSKRISYDIDLKTQFHREAKRLLRQVAKALGLETGTYDLRSNQGGIAVSGEITLHSEQLYVQISQSCSMSGNDVLYRRCNGRKDYCGERNHFASAKELADPAGLAQTITKSLNLTA